MKLPEIAAAAAVICSAMLSSPPVSAGVLPAVTMSSTYAFNNVESTELGWQFQVSSAITVSGLGYYDYAADSPQPALFPSPDNRTSGGLLDNHLVGIFDSGGNLLTSTTIPAGIGGTLIGNFRYTSIPSITLNPGSYVILGTQQGSGGADPTDPVAYLFSSLSTIPEISNLNGVYDFGAPDTLFYTTNSCCGYTAYLGPNFLVGTAVSAIPEPSAGPIALLMLAAAGWFRWHVSRRT